MKLGIMQPYFFPYLGYFELIDRTDKWVVFDVVQYRPKSWMNRNRILHPKDGWQYISVPVSHSRDMAIQDVRVIDKAVSGRQVVNQLNHYRKKGPFFNEVVNLVELAFDRTVSGFLTDLNVQTLTVTCEYLGINFDPSICSQMELNLTEIDHPGKWALKISQQMGVSEYINPPNGRDIFPPEEWRACGIKLFFTELPDF